MWPDRVSNPGPLISESGALPTALRGPARGIGDRRISTFSEKKTLSFSFLPSFLIGSTF